MNYAIQVNSAGVITSSYAGVAALSPPWVTLTAAEYAAIVPGASWVGGDVVPPAAVTLTAAQTLALQAQAALSNGLAVTSTATSTLNGTYAVDDTAQNHVMAEITSIMLDGTFADGTTSVAWIDTAGGSHTFTVAQFKTFASALSSYVANLTKCMLGQITTLPSATATIP